MCNVTATWHNGAISMKTSNFGKLRWKQPNKIWPILYCNNKDVFSTLEEGNEAIIRHARNSSQSERGLYSMSIPIHWIMLPESKRGLYLLVISKINYAALNGIIVSGFELCKLWHQRLHELGRSIFFQKGSTYPSYLCIVCITILFVCHAQLGQLTWTYELT